MNFKRAAVCKAMLWSVVFVSCNAVGMQSITSGANRISEWGREKISRFFAACCNATKKSLKSSKKTSFERTGRKEWEPLHALVFTGDVEQIKCLIAQGADVNAREIHGGTPLHCLMCWDYGTIQRRLALEGLNIDDNSPLVESRIESMINEYSIIMDLLIAHGADVNARDKQGVTPLHLAAEGVNQYCVDVLIKNGAKVNAQNIDGFTPLHAAVFQNNSDAIRLLIKNGADPALCDKKGKMPIDYSKSNEVTMIIRCAMNPESFRNGPGFDAARICNVEKNVKTQLHYAASDIDLKKVKELLVAGADADGRDVYGNTPLHDVMYCEKNRCVIDSCEIIELLIEYGADINAKNDGGVSPLLLAAKEGNLRIVECLIGNGAGVNMQANNGMTPLHVAVAFRKVDVVRCLIGNGADVNLCDNEGMKPLDCCDVPYIANLLTKYDRNQYIRDNERDELWSVVRKKDVEHLKLLLKKGYKTDIRDIPGESLFQYAVRTGIKEIVEVFIHHNVDVNFQDSDGVAPLWGAFVIRNYELVELLIAHGANINIKNKYGFSLMHISVYDTCCDSLDMAIKNGADINIQSNAGYTPLHLAVIANNVEIVEYLIKHGADTSLCDNAGKTAFDYAASFEIAKLLGEVHASNYFISKDSNEKLNDVLIEQMIGRNRVLVGKRSLF